MSRFIKGQDYINEDITTYGITDTEPRGQAELFSGGSLRHHINAIEVHGDAELRDELLAFLQVSEGTSATTRD